MPAPFASPSAPPTVPVLPPFRESESSSEDEEEDGEEEEEEEEEEAEGGQPRGRTAAELKQLEMERRERVKGLGLKLLSDVLGVKNERGYQVAFPFLELPDRSTHPGYYAISKDPTCINILVENVQSSHYLTLRALKDQLVNCFRDCQRYNRPKSSIWLAAQRLKQLTVATTKLLQPRYDRPPVYVWTSDDFDNLARHIASHFHAIGKSSLSVHYRKPLLKGLGGLNSPFPWSRHRSNQSWRAYLGRIFKPLSPMWIAVQAALDSSSTRLNRPRSASTLSSSSSDVVLVSHTTAAKLIPPPIDNSSHDRASSPNSFPSPSASRSPSLTTRPVPSTRPPNPFTREIPGLSEPGPSNYASRARPTSEHARMDLEYPQLDYNPASASLSSRKRRRVSHDDRSGPLEPDSTVEMEVFELEGVKSGLDSLAETRRRMEASLVEHQAELDRIEDERARTTARWDKEKRSMASTISRLQAEVSVSKASEDEVARAHEYRESSLREEILSFKNALSTEKTRRNQEMKTLQLELSSLKNAQISESTRYDSMKHQSSAEILRLRASLASLKSEAEKKEARWSTTQAQMVASHRVEMAGLNNQYRAESERADRLHALKSRELRDTGGLDFRASQLLPLSSQVQLPAQASNVVAASTSSSPSSKEEEIARLKAELADAKNDASSLRAQNKDLLSRRNALRDGLAELDSRR
ncbi:hypothetical protein BDY24DRAFT_440422 [Mrakia frigida]|uniref:uncharacterized protein n=1 Tax=Mrakia frigida TaxID=29902 RepID=UPI003FCC0AE7